MMRLERLVTPWAERAPDQVAVDGDEAMTYRELDQLANRLARLFLACGVKRGDRIGIHLPRSGRGIAAMLGALRAGGVYVPLDPGSPPARMQLIARDCDLRHVFIAPQLLSAWLAAGVEAPVEHFYLASSASSGATPNQARVHSWAEINELDAGPVPALDGSPDELAYLLYTSGSTGTPKGVMLSHRNALSFVDWTIEQSAVTASDRVASVAPFHFDLSVFDIWASLKQGATIVVVDETTVISGQRMLERIHDKQINVWYSVPSALVLMLDNADLAERGAESLRIVFFAGEVFPIKHLRRAMAALPRARFFNLFGPTETNVCTAYALPEPPDPEATAIPIGVASCGDEALILNPEGQPVSDGEVGELFIEGPTVMLGYWDSGRRTPAKHPYPTGDLVSRRPDGNLMYHGRRDHMVKIHGHRIELAEVEAAVLKHPGIREALAMEADQKLVVVAVPSNDAISVLELKRHCAVHVPRYMIPSTIWLVPALPRTSSGKTDRVRTKQAVLADDRSLFESTPEAST
jgi:amino acid adenylation domain-containing protein